MKNFILFILIVFLAVIGFYAFNHYKISINTFFKNYFAISPSVEVQKKPATKPAVQKPSATISVNPPQQPPQETTPKIPDYLIPAGYKLDELSPYFHKVRISSASYSASYGTPTTITLSSSLSKGEKANITGWKIKSNKKEIITPQAIEIYEPGGFGEVKEIVLEGSNYLYFYSNRSAIQKNFRLNKCTGYLEDSYDFNPPIPKNCPTIPRSEFTNLSGACQSYIFSLGSCELPNANTYNSFPGNDEGNACRQALNTISFNSCFDKHKNDSDFLSNEWRIWIGDSILDSQHDRLRLLDKEGLLVDEYIY